MPTPRALIVSVKSVWREGSVWSVEVVNWVARGRDVRRAVEMGVK